MDALTPRREARFAYSPVSVALHWSIALLILLNIAIGWLMENSGPAVPTLPFDAHQAIGLTVLALSVVRLGWRIGHPWPPLPEAMKGWEKALARFTHFAFYVIMIGVPLLGWATVSAIPGAAGIAPDLPVPESKEMVERLGSLHGAGVWAAIVLVVLHVAGALKHTFLDRNRVLDRMIPGRAGWDRDRPGLQ
jgi:cytochrome b561